MKWLFDNSEQPLFTFVELTNISCEFVCFPILHGVRHQILAADEAEDGDVVVVIDYSKGTKNLIEC